jgi:hypothetical protein
LQNGAAAGQPVLFWQGVQPVWPLAISWRVARTLRVTEVKRWCRRRRIMGSPQDPRRRHREKARRARKNAFYDAKKAVEAAASLDRKQPAAAIAKSAK